MKAMSVVPPAVWIAGSKPSRLISAASAFTQERDRVRLPASSPSALSIASRSTALTVAPTGAYFQGLHWFYSAMTHLPPDSPRPGSMTEPVLPPPSADDVRRILAGVLDPELHAAITDLGMVHDVTVSPEGDVTVKIALTTAACPLRAQIGNDVSPKVDGLHGVR